MGKVRQNGYSGFLHDSVCVSRLMLFLVLAIASAQIRAQTAASGQVVKVALDTITFGNGDVLTGRVEKVVFGNLSFYSNELGDLIIPMTKIKTMHTITKVAAGSATDVLTKKTVADQVKVGKIEIANGELNVTLPRGEMRRFPVRDLTFMLNDPAYRRELHSEADLLYGWFGRVMLGATVVASTNNAQTYTGAVGLVRAIPTIAGLPAGSKTIVNLSSTYGLARNAKIVSGGVVFQTAAVTKTDILHGDLEYDKFLTSVVFGLVSGSADHNLGDGLELQQAYGGGMGWGICRTPQNDLSVRASLQFAQQQFYDGITSGLGTPTENLIGSSINETWSRAFSHGVQFNQYVTLNPTFNLVRAYSGTVGASFVFPMYKNLNVSVTTTDNYLGDPPDGFHRNTFQLTTGVVYRLK
jgi:hypothetical protein